MQSPARDNARANSGTQAPVATWVKKRITLVHIWKISLMEIPLEIFYLVSTDSVGKKVLAQNNTRIIGTKQ